MERPKENEYAAFYANYITLAKGSDLNQILGDNLLEIKRFFYQISEANASIVYAPKKWNVREILQHIIDAERIFAYRALRFARNDKTELAGFEENNYAAEAKTNHRTLPDLIDEFIYVRQSTNCMFKNFDEECLSRIGSANKNQISVKALGFVMAGHAQHHVNIITERYLPLFE